MSFHYNYFFMTLLHFAPVPLLKRGNLGVDLFFILSGFVLSHVHLNDFTNSSLANIKKNMRMFLMLRFARIYPLHFVTFIAAVMIFYARHFSGSPSQHQESYTALAALANILLVHSWGFFSTLTWNGPSWSISVEWFLYLLFPFLALCLHRISFLRAAVLAIFSLVIMIVILQFIFHRPNMAASYDYGLIRGTGEFICGICLNVMHRKNVLQHSFYSPLTFLAIFILGAALSFDNSYIAVFAMACLILALASEQGYVAKFLSHPICVYLGTISYSLYLWHVLILNALFAPMVHGKIKDMTSLPAMVLWLMSAPVVLLIAHLSYRYIERPTRSLLRRRTTPVKTYDHNTLS